MFKETAIDKLIEYIRALPQGDQLAIAQKIKLSAKDASKKISNKSKGKIKDFVMYTQSLPTRLPKNYKFDREQANER
jgi:hypothetical protein